MGRDASVPALLDSRFDAYELDALNRLLDAHLSEGAKMLQLDVRLLKNYAIFSVQICLWSMGGVDSVHVDICPAPKAETNVKEFVTLLSNNKLFRHYIEEYS